MTHCDRYFKEMLEDLNIYMERKKDKLFMLPHNLETDTLVAIYTKKGWQQGYIARINEDDTVQVMLRDGHTETTSQIAIISAGKAIL